MNEHEKLPETDPALRQLRELFGDPEFSSEAQPKCLSWALLSAIGNHPVLSISYPVIFISPWLIQFFGDISHSISILPPSANVYVLFASSVLAAVYHFIYLLRAPPSWKSHRTKSDFLKFIKDAQVTTVVSHRQIDVANQYRELVAYTLQPIRCMLTSIICIVVLMVMLLVCNNTTILVSHMLSR